MDRDYIQLCAEMAYNDVIITEALKEEYLIEGEFIDKIKSFFDKIKSFLIRIYNKVHDFIINKIKELKSRIEEFKKKKEEKSQDQKEKEASEKFSKKLKERNSKQESTSLFDQLMEMVLTEGTDYDTALSHVFDIVVNKEIIGTEESISRYKDIAINKLYSINIKNAKEQSEVVKQMESISKEFIDKSNLTINNMPNISEEIEKIVNKYYDPRVNSSYAPSEAFLDMCITISKQHKKACEIQLKNLDQDRKRAEDTYREYSNNNQEESIWKTNPSYTVLYRELMHVYSKQIENYNKLQGSYSTIISELNKYFGPVQRTATVSARL